ncbi:MAG: MscS Mechanosensitive ion channel [Paenibacillaceae bacterium]|jgi:miniconductance mechanosensitive channel|nr:MscS Mechanosensitive ion channel [Paenibacillaceae bacterium]
MERLQQLLTGLGTGGYWTAILANIILIACIALLSILANWITKKVVLQVISRYIHKTKYQWDNALLERKVFHKLSHVVPAIIIYFFSFMFPAYQGQIVKGVSIYMNVVGILVLNAFLNAVNDIYCTYEISKARPIRGYIQMLQIFVWIIGSILAISTLAGKSPLLLLSGIGALSAVLLLIFKDSLLGLVAGVQLASNDMVQVGDWIDMPKYGADGSVTDISLNTVKVQNWDKTITTIPAYALISDSFRNWRGMISSGGRRIKRAVYVDTGSIRFCTPEMIGTFRKIQYLKDYIDRKSEEIEQFNLQNGIDRSSKVNGRALTNIGVFRAYIQHYIERHPSIHPGMTRMVRQLEPGPNGLPIEIYAFSNTTEWAVYEGVQSDIFDHILAVASEFGLRVFQSPSGHDLHRLTEPASTGSPSDQPNQTEEPRRLLQGAD